MNASVIDLAEKQAAMCKVFGSARRLIILWLISKEELSVHAIAERVGSSLQNVSQHLRLMRDKGIPWQEFELKRQDMWHCDHAPRWSDNILSDC